MNNEFNKFVFKGTQEELNDFIIKSELYEVPIAKWDQLLIVYNKLDGLFQNEHGGWGDIFLYFAKGFKPPFQDSLDDIEKWLKDMDAPQQFINTVIDLLFDNRLDTYNDDLTEDDIKQINEAMKNQNVIELDPDYYDIYMKAEEYYDKIGKEFIEFDPASIEIKYDYDN